MNKYKAVKTTVNGIVFDSKRESERYIELLIMQKSGLIKDLELQPKFELQARFRHNGKIIRPITYTADFKYAEAATGRIVIEDVKSIETQVFKVKLKLFLKQYGHLYDFRIVK